MSGNGSGPLQATWHGFIQNSMDGLMLFEACLSGKLHHVPRRPHDRERASLIKSGSVFIYEENASGIKRWTDGVAWSPSRILGNFLIYRELEKPFPPGEKKRAMKRKRSSQEPEGRRDSEENETEYNRLPPTPPSPENPADSKTAVSGSQDADKEMERQLIGSLVDSYGFRPNGLVKKTMSITLQGVQHHLVSYYTVEDVKARKLLRPLTDSRLTGLTIRPELFHKQNFRAPIEESEHYAVDSSGNAHPHMVYSSMVPQTSYMRAGGYVPPPGYPMYNTAVTTTPVYGALPATAAMPTTATMQTGSTWPHQYATANTQSNYDYYNRNTSSTPQGAYPPMQSSQYHSPMRAPSQSYGQQHSMNTSSTPIPSASAPPSQYQPGSYSIQQSGHQQSSSPQQHHQQSMRSPIVGPTHSMNGYSRSSLPTMNGSYRQYPTPSAGSASEMPGIGMASQYNSAPQAQPSSNTYSTATYTQQPIGGPQGFRHVGETGPGVQAGQY